MELNRFEEFTYIISKIYRSIQKIKLEELQKYELKGSHMSYVYFIGNSEEGLSFKEISDLSPDNKGLVSRNLKQLERRNIIFKEIENDKVYKGKFKLSLKGKEVFTNITKKTEELCEYVYLDNKELEIEDFYANLNKISEKLDLIVKKYYD